MSFKISHKKRNDSLLYISYTSDIQRSDHLKLSLLITFHASFVVGRLPLSWHFWYRGHSFATIVLRTSLAQSQEQENIWPPPHRGHGSSGNFQTPPPPPRTWKLRQLSKQVWFLYTPPPPPTSDLEAQVTRKLWDPITLLVIWWSLVSFKQWDAIRLQTVGSNKIHNASHC